MRSLSDEVLTNLLPVGVLEKMLTGMQVGDHISGSNISTELKVDRDQKVR